ncbi:DUF952 domain-containing protein [Salipaludibacillus sp. CUR1]|uniref:Uncharacterized conserved protein, DUF952 family n=1 Tax=Salipaludibacillus aurantiacus TaxID=1601833 RepID=A0A1H9VUH2_9BACI|nr:MULTISPECIES: DUF952 domain-containing protein [Salipaludibacillus]MCE7791997.1 DUF952 domain-containing protein [Salipaludibacillus sp. CUR1]SES24933.1 Uncharacterized conserved protein, DUF952 family [Salipaludibacillus aurantiacus]
MILYVLTEEEWEFAQEEEEYWPEDFDDRGYIPCANPGQTEHLVNELNLTDEPLVLLTIDPDKLESVIIYEDVHECGTMSPHIYGYINIDAVTGTEHYELSRHPMPS